MTADQLKTLMENMHMSGPSALIIPFRAKDRLDPDSELIDDPSSVMADYDFMKTYFPELCVHNRCMYSNVLMCFNKPLDELIKNMKQTLIGDGQATYK
jgi:hypothetical protein